MSFVAKLRKWSNYSALHRFDVKTIKNVQCRQKHSKERKTTKLIKLQWIASIWCQNDKKKTHNYKRDQITINLHRFDVKTIENIEVRSQNIQNNAKLPNCSNYNWLHRFVFKTIQNVEIRRKTTKVIKL